MLFFEEKLKVLLADLQGQLATEHRCAVQRLEAKIAALESEFQGPKRHRHTVIAGRMQSVGGVARMQDDKIAAAIEKAKEQHKMEWDRLKSNPAPMAMVQRALSKKLNESPETCVTAPDEGDASLGRIGSSEFSDRCTERGANKRKGKRRVQRKKAAFGVFTGMDGGDVQGVEEQEDNGSGSGLGSGNPKEFLPKLSSDRTILKKPSWLVAATATDDSDAGSGCSRDVSLRPSGERMLPRSSLRDFLNNARSSDQLEVGPIPSSERTLQRRNSPNPRIKKTAFILDTIAPSPEQGDEAESQREPADERMGLAKTLGRPLSSLLPGLVVDPSPPAAAPPALPVAPGDAAIASSTLLPRPSSPPGDDDSPRSSIDEGPPCSRTPSNLYRPECLSVKFAATTEEEEEDETCTGAGDSDKPELRGCEDSESSVGAAQEESGSDDDDEDDEDEGETFHVLGTWNIQTPTSKSLKSKTSRRKHDTPNSSVRSSLYFPSDMDDGLEEAPGGCLKYFMMQPNSPKRLCWEFACIVLVVMDILLVPLQLLDPMDNACIHTATWVARIFWTLDIVLSFFTGYVAQGNGTSELLTEMRPFAVACRYARTRFVLDCVLVLSDWMEVAVRGMHRFMTLLFVVRALRLTRFAKAKDVAAFVMEHIRSEMAMISTYVVGILFLWTLLIHVIACIWHGIQGARVEERTTTIGNSLTAQYMDAFHYVLALFVGEQIERPTSLAEQLFTVALMGFAFVASAAFVGSLTTAMTRLQIIASQRSAQFAALSRYLSDCGISRNLAVKVQRNARHAFKERKRNTPESSVELIGLISDPLRAEIHYEVHAPLLTRHPFFFLYRRINLRGVRQICHTTVEDIKISRGDVLFSQFEVLLEPKMFFVSSGGLNYYIRGGEHLMKVSSNEWVSEAALWTIWVHRGSLVASTECQLTVIDATRFMHVATSFQTQHANLYALKFVEALNFRSSEGELLTDLGQDDAAARHLVSEAFQDVDSDFSLPDTWFAHPRTTITSAASFHNLSASTRGKLVAGGQAIASRIVSLMRWR